MPLLHTPSTERQAHMRLVSDLSSIRDKRLRDDNTLAAQSLTRAGYEEFAISALPDTDTPGGLAIKALRQSLGAQYGKILDVETDIEALDTVKSRLDLDLVALIPLTVDSQEIGSYTLEDGRAAHDAIKQRDLTLVKNVDKFRVYHAGHLVTIAAVVHKYNAREDASELLPVPRKYGAAILRTSNAVDMANRQRAQASGAMADLVWPGLYHNLSAL